MEQILMKVVKWSEIVVESRAREDYGDVDLLADSMKKEGIIQPLAVRANDDGTYKLLAGGRRMRAAEKAKIEDIPVRVYPPTLSDKEMLAIELMENIARKDLTWLEQAKLKTDLHNLQVEIHGSKLSTAPGASGWSTVDTAKLLGKSIGNTYDDIKLARAAESIPALAECKTKQEAAKLLAKVKEKMILEEMANRAKAKQGPTEQLHRELVDKFILGDFFEKVKEIPDGSVKLCEVDPPYGIDLPDVKKSFNGVYTDSYNEVPKDKYAAFMFGVLAECYRIMAPDSWLILWYATEPWAESVYQWAVGAGFVGRRLGGYWTKATGQTKQPDVYLASAVEPFYYLAKGKPVIAKPGRTNNFAFRPVPPASKIHPTERPVELVQEILTTFVDVGSRIVVPFAGSGNTLLACANLGMDGTGFELSKEYQNSYILRVHASRPPLYRSYKEEGS